MLDDYGNIAAVRHESLARMAADNYRHWNGRFATVPAYYAAAQLPTELYGVASLAMLALLLTAGYVLARQALPRVASALVAVTCAGAVFALAPDPVESFFWISGSVCYLLPLGVVAMLAAAVVRQGRPRRWEQLAIFGLGFLATGFNETIAAALPMLLFGLFLLHWRRNDRNLLRVMPALTGTLIGLLVVVKAPGNSARKSFFPGHPTIGSLVGDAFAYAQQFLNGLFHATAPNGVWPQESSHPLAIIATVFLVAALVTGATRPSATGRESILARIGVALVACLGTVLLCFGIGAYSVHAPLPDRAVTFPILAVIVTLAYIGGVVGVSSQRGAVVAACALLVALVFGPGNDARLAAISAGAARTYVARWDASDRAFRNGAPVPPVARPAGLAQAMRLYYGQAANRPGR
jgi:hypothetical protein